MHSPDLVESNIDKLAELFPNCLTESLDKNGELKKSIDFDQLKQELSEQIVVGPQERYHLNWPGKREALLTANAPIAKTLRPCVEESVDFDTTENLFIEGDNLDALKLLQDTYLGKVKMIYIDPPYNTGNDFIYEDDFSESSDEYLQKSNQKDELGNRLITNSDSNGRFHSDWLSMIYPRLKLARNLLKDDGVVFISIDDKEVTNLSKICNEVFGEENLVGTIVWKNVTDNNPTNIATEHESIIVYSKSKISLEGVWKSKLSDIKNILIDIGEKLNSKFNDQETLQLEYSKWFKDNKSQLGKLDRYKYIDNGGIYTGSQSVHNPGKEGYRYDVIHPETKIACKEPLMGYRFPQTTMTKLLDDGKILFGTDHNKIIELKVYAKDYLDKLSSVIELDGRIGAYDVRQLFPEMKKVFTNPKPVALIEQYISFVLEDSGIILDFFSGSSTTAHAVMQLNANDNGNRKFIMVQLPESCDKKSDAYKAGYSSISEISKERIRRAGKKIKEDNPDTTINLDTGFRVLKIDSSNMEDVYYSPDAIDQKMLAQMKDNIKDDRTDEDLLFQVLLDWGVDLSLPIKKEVISGHDVFFVDDNALLACFVKFGEITEDFVKALAKYEPLRMVFRDAGYKDSSVKINVEQIFKLMSPHTEIKTI